VLSKQLEGIIKLIRKEMTDMNKPILTHTITASSYDELDTMSHEWLKKMHGKIEVLETINIDPEKIHTYYLEFTYYMRDNRQVEFTMEELEYIAELFHDELKKQPDNKALQSIEKKVSNALGWG
jgi:hypothetical protein